MRHINKVLLLLLLFIVVINSFVYAFRVYSFRYLIYLFLYITILLAVYLGISLLKLSVLHGNTLSLPYKIEKF